MDNSMENKEPIQPAEQAAQPAKKPSARERRKARRVKRKAIRREIRDRKLAKFRSKGVIGKIFYLLGRLIALVFKIFVIVALTVTVIKVNTTEINKAVIGALFAFGGAEKEPTEEQITLVTGCDEENAAVIDATEPYAEDETWAIYVYMVGSDLEARSGNQLSEAALTITGIEGEALYRERIAAQNQSFTDFMDTIVANGLDLPNTFYEKTPVSGFEYLYGTVNDLFAVKSNFGAASVDLNTIFEVQLPENVQLVFQPGGAPVWGHDMINPNRTQRFLYDSHGVSQVYDGHISNMGDPETLADFLRFCEDEYPADHTMVVLWNHGGGPFGYGVDSLYLGDRLTNQELSWAFDQVYDRNEKNPELDIIGFDACLMANMEVANELHGFARYLLGSEDTEPGDGWDYTAWLGALAENPRMNALQLCKEVTDSYIEYYARLGAVKGVSSELFSIIDLSLGDDIYNAYADFAATALRECAEYAGTPAVLGKSANSSIKYAGGDNSYNLVDLGLFMESVSEFYPDEAQKVLELLDKAVLYNRANNMAKGSTGMTVYYPATITGMNGLIMGLEYINQVCRSEDIAALYYYKMAGCLPEEMLEYLNEQGYGEIKPMDFTPLKQMRKAEVTLNDDGSYTVDFNSAAATITQDIDFNLMQIDEEGRARSLGQDKYVALAEDESNLTTTYKGKWVFFGDQPLAVKCISSTMDTIRYSSDIMLNNVHAKLLLGYDFNTMSWSVIGVQNISTDSESLLADRNTETLNPGDAIAPIYNSYDMSTGAAEMVTGDTFIYREETELVEKELPQGEYISYISLTDARGEIYSLPVVSFELDGGVISDAENMELSWVKAA